jgi:TetR/AcrR family transcriptional repressor of nem operon
MTAGFRAQIDRMSNALPAADAKEGCRAAIRSWAAMMGAVIVARAIDDPELSDEVLEQTRDWIATGLSYVSGA